MPALLDPGLHFAALSGQLAGRLQKVYESPGLATVEHSLASTGSPAQSSKAFHERADMPPVLDHELHQAALSGRLSPSGETDPGTGIKSPRPAWLDFMLLQDTSDKCLERIVKLVRHCADGSMSLGSIKGLAADAT